MSGAISRRRFLAGAAATAAGASTAVALGRRPIEHLLEGSPAPSPGILVLVALYGGNDGLNTVIPYQQAAYLSSRPSLGFQPGEVIPLDHDLALNPSLKGLKGLWDAKQLAIVRGVGYPNPNYSHFRSMDIWQSAVPETDEVTGWLGRWLDNLGGRDPLAAVSLGATMPKLLQGAKTAGASIPSGRLTLPRDAPAFETLASADLGQGALFGRVAQSGADMLTALHTVSGVLTAQPSLISGTGQLETQLDVVARCVKGNLGTRVYVVSAGSYDTHGDERATQQRLLADLDAALTAFVKAVSGHEVTVMTFSEFGRRVAENASGGTDHGSAAPLFVMGPRVKGGYYGDEPSLTDLDGGNLKYTTDFRSVYATVLESVIGVDPASLLGKRFPTLGFV